MLGLSNRGRQPDDLLTTSQLAEVLQITEAAVRKAAAEGRLPGFKPTGRSWRFRWGDIVAVREVCRAD